MCICVCPSVSVSVCVRTLPATGHQFVTSSLKLALLRAAQRSTRPVHAYLSPRRRRTLLTLSQWRPLHVNTALIPSFSISFFIALSPTVDQRTQRSGLYFGVMINMGEWENSKCTRGAIFSSAGEAYNRSKRLLSVSPATYLND